MIVNDAHISRESFTGHVSSGAQEDEPIESNLEIKTEYYSFNGKV